MKIKAHAQTDVGQKRDHNEDYFLADDDLGLYIVCDGMGGHAAGEVAAEMAATTTLAFLKERAAQIKELDESPDSTERAANIARLAVEEASSTVYQHATSTEGRAGMGCTLTMVLVVGGRGVMAHVGDSRLYLLRKGTLHQLSDDHSYVAEMVRKGIMSPDAAEKSPYGNVITRAIGIQSTVQVDTLVFDILPDDTYLICSDGLSGYVEDRAELGDLLDESDLNTLGQRLINIANERGGKDNITAVLLRAEKDADDDGSRAGEVNLRLDTLRFISLFKHLTMKELVTVMNAFEVREYDAKEAVIFEGESSDGLYVVMAGGLEVSRGGTQVAKLSKGDHFGEMALLNQRPRSATVTTTEPSRLLVMGRDAFNDCLKRDATLGVKFLWTFAQTLSLRLDEELSKSGMTADLPAETQKMQVLPMDIDKA